jgi:alanine racemase
MTVPLIHFASADENDKTFSYNQINIFKNVIASLEAKGIIILLKHLAGSAATIGLPEGYFDMVRPGISLYGIYPSARVNQSIELQQVMTLKTKIAFLKEMPKEAPISYGRTFVTKRRSRIATLPVGYADGYSRLLSNHGETLVCGKRAPVVGRVCMDMTMIDVTDIPGAQVGSEVVLFGKQNDAEIPVIEIAQKTRTISHEIMCGINRRVPIQYLQ